MRTIICGLLLILFCGCANQIQSARFDAVKWEPDAKKVNGVVYYEPQLVRIRYEFTTRIDEKGKLLGTSAAGTCKQTVQKEELSVQPNYDEPRVLLNVPSQFATGKFGVTLSNGMLTAVNSETSSQVLPELLKQVSSFKDVGILEAPVEGPTACNAGPVITSITKQEIPWSR